MASPQEVLEVFIPHPSDSTEASRAHAAKTVMKGLALNDYYFMRRKTPLTDRHAGECKTCGCDMVYIEHDKTFTEAAKRIEGLTKTLEQRDVIMRDVTKFLQAIASGKLSGLAEIRKIANDGLGIGSSDGSVKLLPPEEMMPHGGQTNGTITTSEPPVA